jgi:predicted nucleic acid-binding protein
MILVDTNVVSELMKIAPLANVVNWLNIQKFSDRYVLTITLGEIVYGLHILPDAKRRLQLIERFERFDALAFAQHVLSYDEAAAHAYGEVMSHRKAVGHPMSVPDGQIAAIARSRGFRVATRNSKDFEDCGIDLIDPYATD